jgi:hypothetical protein
MPPSPGGRRPADFAATTPRPDHGLIGFSGRFRARDRAANGRALIGMGLLLAGLVTIPLIDVIRMTIVAEREEQAWTITGPACARVDKPSPVATSRRGVQRHRYGDISFARSFGAVSCAAFEEPGLRWKPVFYRVCQFNNPGAVTVTTPRERVTFEGVPGRPVTVTVRGGRASCVIAGWFRVGR